jgi:alkaline phosphatase D
MDRRRLLQTTAYGTLLSSLGACTRASVTLAPAQVSPQTPPWPTAIHKIAFGSCIDQNKAQPIWQAILANQPDLFIFGGDNVYASGQPWQLGQLEKAYATQAAQPGFAQLRDTIAHVAIWDDHDMGLNDGGAEFPHMQASKNAFLDFWRLPANDPRRARDGLYHAMTFGETGQRVQIILLDTRTFRSAPLKTDQRDAPGKERYLPDRHTSKTMLGEKQWQWLATQLQTPADIRFIVSGVQVIVEGHGWEGWNNFPLEQEKLRQLIQHTGAKGVVLLSGDRHIGAIYKSTSPNLYPLYEMTSSGITHAWQTANEAGPNRIGALVTQNHFALIELDWQKKEMRWGFKNTQDEWLKKESIALSELQ